MLNDKAPGKNNYLLFRLTEESNDKIKNRLLWRFFHMLSSIFCYMVPTIESKPTARPALPSLKE